MFPHTETQRTIPNERTHSPTKHNTLGPILGAVAGFLLVAITVLGIATAVLAHCKKKVKLMDPVYDYIDRNDGSVTIPMQPLLNTATNKANGTIIIIAI